MTDPFKFLAEDRMRKLLECEPCPESAEMLRMLRQFINDFCEKWDRCKKCFGPYHEPWQSCPLGNDEGDN